MDLRQQGDDRVAGGEVRRRDLQGRDPREGPLPGGLGGPPVDP
jgi:hypothetical protein